MNIYFGNYLFIILMIIFMGLPIASYFIFRNKTQTAKDTFIWILIIISFFMTWGIYIYSLFVDEYQRIHFIARLPFHLCSINPVLYGVVFAFRRKWGRITDYFYQYMFYIGSAGALMGLLIPPSDCIGYFFKYNVYSYWIKHGLIFAIPLCMVSLGYLKPRIKDMWKASFILLCFLVVMTGVDYLLTWVSHLQGVYDTVNFFYILKADNFVLKFFYDIIPLPFFYMLPMIIIVIPIQFIYWGIYRFVDFLLHCREKKQVSLSE